MSLTVAQLMELPCLRRAKVLAGHQSLERIVTGITVLEYATPTDMQKKLYESIDFKGSELVLTGFCNVADDVEAQCFNIRRLAMAGEVGMILYYVGLILPKVDPKVIRQAEELGFVLICMQENDPHLQYGEVIREAMDAIIRDELSNPTFAMDLLEQMTKLPANQQNVKTVLRITSDRLRASAVITDSEYHVLSEASWPRNQSVDWKELIKRTVRTIGLEANVELEKSPSLWCYRAELHTGSHNRMYLFVLSEHGTFEPVLWKQAVEGVNLCMGVWGKNHDQLELSELVRAILQDEPIKMRRLGDLYHIDVSSLSDMWILRSIKGKNLSHWTKEIRELSRLYTKIGLCESYENDILIFPVGNRTLREMDEWSEALNRFFDENQISVHITRCPLLAQTSDVKYAYEVNQQYLEDTVKVFPRRSCYTASELEFVKECREIAAKGKKAVGRFSSLLSPILEGKDGKEIVDTLSSYLLDQNSSITDTAAVLFVHKNTVKYRLHKASDYLGFRVGDIPQSQNLLCALALRRLMNE